MNFNNSTVDNRNENTYYSKLQTTKHPFHMVRPSPWPLLTSAAAFFTVLGATLFIISLFNLGMVAECKPRFAWLSLPEIPEIPFINPKYDPLRSAPMTPKTSYVKDIYYDENIILDIESKERLYRHMNNPFSNNTKKFIFSGLVVGCGLCLGVAAMNAGGYVPVGGDIFKLQFVFAGGEYEPVVAGGALGAALGLGILAKQVYYSIVALQGATIINIKPDMLASVIYQSDILSDWWSTSVYKPNWGDHGIVYIRWYYGPEYNLTELFEMIKVIRIPDTNVLLTTFKLPENFPKIGDWNIMTPSKALQSGFISEDTINVFMSKLKE